MKKYIAITTLLAAAAAASVSAYADASYTSTTNGTGSTAATLVDDDGVSVTNPISLSDISGTLEISGNSTGASIASSADNGGIGGRVSFADGSSTDSLTKIVFNDGIEANVENIQSSTITFEFDNASFFGSTSAYAFNMSVLAGGVRLNGGGDFDYTYAGTITGTGNIYSCTGNGTSHTNTFTGDTTGFSGAWLQSRGSRTWIFGDGTQIYTSVGGSSFGASNAKLIGVTFNYNSDYSVSGDIYATTLTVSGGNATLAGTTIDAGTVSVASGATATIDESSTLSGVTTVSGAGTLTVNGTLSLGGTLTNSATLVFGSGSNLTLTGDLETAYSDYSAGGYVDKDGSNSSTDGNGYAAGASVTVISGGTLTDSGNVSVSHGALTDGTLDSSGKVTFGTDYSTYHVNSGDVAFDTSLFHDDTTTVAIADGAKVTLSEKTLSGKNISGTGTLSLTGLSTDDNGQGFSLSDFNGTLRNDTSGGRLLLSSTTLGSSAQIVVCADGDVVFNESSTTLANNITFEGGTGSEIHVNTNKAAILTGTVSAENNTVTKRGGGTLTLSGSATFGTFVNAVGTTTFSGTANIGTLGVSAGTVNFTNTSSATTLGTVSLLGGTLGVGGTGNTIGTLEISGSATTVAFNVNTNQNALSISNLTGEGTLNYTSSVNSGYNMVLTLGDDSTTSAGAFSGEINVSGTAGTGGYRRTVLVIADGGIAENAVVNFGSLSSSSDASRYLALGVAADNVTIAGLTSSSSVGTYTRIVSGAVNTASTSGNNSLNGDFVGDGTTRTLTINAAENGDYTYAGTILANVNLVKDGAGTQTLTGASSVFSGTVEIRGGVLALGNAAAIGSDNSVMVAGGHLSVASGVELNSTAITVVLSDVYSDAATAAILGEGTLASGTTITLDMDGVAAALAAETSSGYSYYLFGNSTLASNLDESAISLSDSLVNAGYTFSYDSGNGLITLSTIPEPSAFGLLAGLGALALVASRRRRK